MKNSVAMTPKSLSYILLGVVIVLVVIFLFANRGDQHDRLNLIEVNGVDGGKAVVPNSSFYEKEDSSIKADPVARDIVVRMVDGFNTSKNYRELYEVALKNPEGGGIFYAANILSICSVVKNETKFGQEIQTPYTSDMSSETYRKISEAAEGLRSKCSAFIPQELSQEHVEKISRFEASNKDPLATLSKALGEVGFKNIEERRRLVNDVVRLGDPLLASELGMRLAIAPHPETGRPIFMFGGKIYPLDSKVDVGHALYMLPCSMGLKCDKDDFDIALKCASNAGCYEGRVEYVREMMAAGSRDFDGTMRLYEEMAEAVRAGDLTKFMN